MHYKEKTALKRRVRARRVIKRSADEGKTLAELSSDDKLNRNFYGNLVRAAGFAAEYKVVKAGIVKPENAHKQRIKDALKRVVDRSLQAENSVKRIAVAQALIDECLRLQIPISRLARMHGCTPRNYIVKLESSGLYPLYKELLGVSKGYRTSPDTMAAGQAVLDRCKSLNTTYNALAVSDGKTHDMYCRLLVTTKLMGEYREWRRQIKIGNLKARLNMRD